MNYKKIIPKIIAEYELLEGDVEGLDKNGEEGVAEYIAYELKKIEDTRRYIYNCKEEIREQTERYNVIIKDLQSVIAKHQQSCKHWELTYSGDPAGGSDSYFECGICRLQKKRF